MAEQKLATMSDRRALLTDREREIVAGNADISDSYRYQTVSRIRQRFRRLDGDMEALGEHGELLSDLRSVVCKNESEEENDE